MTIDLLSSEALETPGTRSVGINELRDPLTATTKTMYETIIHGIDGYQVIWTALKFEMALERAHVESIFSDSTAGYVPCLGSLTGSAVAAF